MRLTARHGVWSGGSKLRVSDDAQLNRAEPSSVTDRRTTSSQPRSAVRPLPSAVLPVLAVPVALCLLSGSSWMIFGFVGVLALAVLRWFIVGSPLPATVLNVPLLVLLAMLAISFRLSPSPDLAVPTAAKILGGITLYFALFDTLHTPLDLWRGAGILALLGLGLAIAAPFSVQWMKDKLYDVPFLYSSFPQFGHINPNKVAGAIVPLVPIALALVVAGPGNWRLAGALALLPMLFTLILLQSRGAFVALAVGLLVYGSLYRRWILPAAFLIMFLASVSYLAVSNTGIARDELVANSLEGIRWREALAVRAFDVVLDSPLIGTGLGAYPIVAARDFPNIFAEPTTDHSHNLFVQVALDTGVVGLAAFAVVLGIAVYALWRAYRSKFELHLVVGLLSALAIVVTHGLVDEIFWGTQPGAILWLILALAAGFEMVGHTIPASAGAKSVSTS